MITIPLRTALGRAVVTGACIASLANPQNAPACAGSFGPACALSPIPCLKTLSLAKSAPTGMGLIGFPGGTVTLVFTLTATCTGCPGTPCPMPAVPTTATASVACYPGGAGPCPPLPPGGPPTFAFTTPVALPACSPVGAFTTYTIVVPVPAGTPLGVYCAYGTVTVTFSDGMMLSANGDTAVCIVDPVPGMPGVPRLSVTLLSPSAPRMAAGDQAVARYVVKNNDPSNSVTLMAIAGSRQSAVRPQGANERQGVFALSNPFGDDFPILFNPGSNCIPLPPHPYTQAPLSNALPVIPPGGSNVIQVGIRSYGQCANGSCSESTLKVSGLFSDNTPAFGCAGMALVVDTGMPSSPCAQAVNDCNHNGIPDALDIKNGISQDRNYNALPDECEQVINVPTSTAVTPTNPQPGQPILVQIAFNEAVPMVNVWGDGMPLIRMTIGGIPFWQGTIPADTRPGPQTVYFLGRDQLGGLATFIAPYNVQALNTPPTISDIPNQIIPQNSTTGPIPFTIGDAETPPNALSLTGTSSNPLLVPNANIGFGGTGLNRTVTVTPAPNQTGIATITVTVSDGSGGTATDTFTVTVQPSGVAEVLSPTANPTPPNFIYGTLSTAQPIAYPNGIILRNIRHGRLRFHPVPPLPSSTLNYSSDSDVRFDFSTNGGASFSAATAPGTVVVRMVNVSDDGTTRTFQTEMLSLDIAGGDLPPGVRIRESPTLVSPGQATSRFQAGGGALVSSFFDVNTELSVNNGATWQAGIVPARVILSVEAAEVFSISANPTPPNAAYVSPPTAPPTTNQNGVVIRTVSHGRLRLHPPPPPLGSNLVYTSDGEVRLTLVMPGTTAVLTSVAPSTVAVRLSQVKDDGTSLFFDTEMLSLDIAGGTLPATLRFRESPTRQSLGRATARFVRGGGAMVSSYFNVELEASLNNGATYQPFLLPVRIELALEAPENISISANPTPPNFSYNTPTNPPLIAATNSFAVRRVRHGRLTLHPPPPPVGGSLVYNSPSTAILEYSRDGGQTFLEATATGTVSVRVVGAKNDGTSLFFDTEMLSLDLAGGTLPAGVRLRESPTRQSLGRATSRFAENGATLVSSFFDVNIEVSTNNGAAWAPLAQPVHIELASEDPENLSVTDDLTPANSAYVSPVGAPAINYGAGLFTRDYIHFRLLPHPPPPPLGGSLVYTSTGLARFQVSLDGARTFQNVEAAASTTVRMTHATDVGPTSHFDTEMLALDFSGGNLPAALRIRLSPTKRSFGQASVRLTNPDPTPPGFGPQPVWGLSSFFDLNTELSTDNGATWRPATASQRVVLDARAPQNYSPGENLTPANAAYVSPPNAPFIPYTNGIITRNYVHYRLRPHPPLPPIGTTQLWTSDGLAQFQVTLNGGQTWLDILAPAITTVRLTHTDTAGPHPSPWGNATLQTFDTELLQLDIVGGNLPPGVRLRIDPTRASRGQATVHRVEGGEHLSSFIDIWTQLSLNNGATWHNSKTDQRVQLDSRGLENLSMTGNLTPANGAYVSGPAAPPIFYVNGILTRDYLHYRLRLHPIPPPLGGNIVFTSPGIVDFCVSVNGGQSFVPVRANAATTVRMTHSADVPATGGSNYLTQFFDTEMLQLDISGGGLPGGLLIRVSPTRPSRGQATIEQVDGGYRLSSFFDLWTDVSLDNGATWSPAVNPQRVSLDARAPETKVPEPNLTPVNSAYVSAANSASIRYPGNIVTRFYNHGRLLPHPPPPPLGTNQIYTTGGQAIFEVSVDGGNTFNPVTANAATSVRLTHAQDAPDPSGVVSFFETEMLQLDISGGTLPPGIRLRISPNPARPSRGQAALQRLVPPIDPTFPPGPVWDVASSFFDLNTDISLNNGQTWLPALNAQRVVLEARAPESLHPTPVLPPRNVSFNTDVADLPLRFGNGALIARNYRHRLLTNVIVPPILGSNRLYSTLGSELFFEVSSDGGQHFQAVRALANMSLNISHAEDSAGTGIQYYDTELLSLDFATGGGLPAGVMFRESPTRRSLGQTTIRPVQGVPGQGPPPPSCENISSGMDIWVDVSLDAGQNWLAADHAARVRAIAAAPEVALATNTLPPIRGRYRNPFGNHARFPGGFDMSIVRHRRFLQSFPPPPLGSNDVHSFGSQLDISATTNGGLSSFNLSVPATVTVSITHVQDVGTTEYYDTEMLALDASGGSLPANLRLRESPSRASLGQTIIRRTGTPAGAGGYEISSFFEIWPELSPDGGQTWVASSTPTRVELERENLPLFAAGGPWRYLDNGTDQGIAWRNPSFNDSTWASGPAELGYGDGDELTTVSYGPNANNKFITTYFRQSFSVADPSAVNNLTLRVKRDDGVIVYVNGTEVFRDNLPAGAVTFTTLAPVAVADDGNTWLNVALNPAVLVNGGNLIAAEVHQNATNSSDISFDLELLANSSVVAPSSIVITSPADGSVVFGTTATLAATVVFNDEWSALARVEFYEGNVLLGSDPTAPFSLTAPFAGGSHTVIARAVANTGGTLNSAPVTFTVTPVISLIPTGAVWRYLDNGSDQGTAWQAFAFNDTSWKIGGAEFGYGEGDETTPLARTNSSGSTNITFYFRHAFSNPVDICTVTGLLFGVLRDDGVVVYLNGFELFRQNMPPGPINYLTTAPVAVAGVDETTFFPETITALPGLLRAGTNVLAAEVHQQATTSSDVSFNLRLDAVLGPPLRVLTISRSGTQVTITWNCGGVLQSSPTLGPTANWTDVTGNPGSPFQTAPAGNQRFFRVR